MFCIPKKLSCSSEQEPPISLFFHGQVRTKTRVACTKQCSVPHVDTCKQPLSQLKPLRLSIPYCNGYYFCSGPYSNTLIFENLFAPIEEAACKPFVLSKLLAKYTDDKYFL